MTRHPHLEPGFYSNDQRPGRHAATQAGEDPAPTPATPQNASQAVSEDMKMDELRGIARDRDISVPVGTKKADLVALLNG